MSIYKFLEKRKKRRTSFSKLEEYSFFIKNRDILLKMPKFAFLFNNIHDEFSIIRANIVIQSYFNKVLLEEEIKALNEYKENGEAIDKKRFTNILKDKLLGRPFFNYNDTKLYIPFFNPHLNEIYIKESEKILNYPYINLLDDFSNSLIDMFDLYGAKIYDSNFTRLINIGTNGKEIAYFHYDTNTIYIVNNQGRLDVKIVLFDRYIKRPALNHMLERLKPVIEAYFNNSRIHFIHELYKNDFISEKIYNMVKRKDIDGEI